VIDPHNFQPVDREEIDQTFGDLNNQ